MELITFINEKIADIKNGKGDGVKEYGLYKGKAGLAILYFSLFRYTREKVFEDRAKLILDEIGENIASVEQLNYSDGLAGIGWAIEWIAQNKFITINTDEVLEDIDDTIYRSVLYAPDKTISLSNGTLSKAVYFLKRYESKNKDTHRFKIICHQECLVLLTDEINEKTALFGENSDVGEFFKNDIEASDFITDLAHSLVFLSKVFPYKINAEATESTLYANIKCIEILLKDLVNENRFTSLTIEMKFALLLSAYAYYYSGVKIKCDHWEQEGIQYVNKILWFSKSLPISYNEWVKQFPILSRLFCQTGKEYYRERIMNMTQPGNFGRETFNLSNGYSGSLAAISCIQPSNILWDEALLYS